MKLLFSRSFLCLSCLAALAACGEGSVREKLGIDKSSPDEFRVVSRPPLSVPPQFNLIPPAPGDSMQGKTPAHKEAESLLLGTSPDAAQSVPLIGGNVNTAVAPVSSRSLGGSSAESQFLRNAGADKADASVRTSLVEEKIVREQEKEEDSWWPSFGFSSDAAAKEPMVDARKEKERIKENKAEGKPVTEGETPEVQGKNTGLLGRIFGY